MTCDGRRVKLAIFDKSKNDVFDANIALGLHTRSSCLNTFSLIAIFSNTASITKSTYYN